MHTGEISNATKVIKNMHRRKKSYNYMKILIFTGNAEMVFTFDFLLLTRVLDLSEIISLPCCRGHLSQHRAASSAPSPLL